MDEPRYTWHYVDDRDEWPYEVRDHETATVVARCETKDDAKFLQSLLEADDAPRRWPTMPGTVYGTAKVGPNIRWR